MAKDASHEMRRAAANSAVATLNPGYFALVMSTGIVSVGMLNHKLAALSTALLWIAVACFAVLLLLTTWRAISFRDELRADFTDPRRGFGFFTFVASTDVLGTRFALAGFHRTAFLLLTVGWISWLLLGYIVPWTSLLGGACRRSGANHSHWATRTRTLSRSLLVSRDFPIRRFWNFRWSSTLALSADSP